MAAVILICDQSLFLTSHCRTHNNLFMPENVARLSETFSRAHDLMDIDKNVVLGKRSFPNMLFGLVVNHHLKRLWLTPLNMYFLQVSLSIFWKIMTLLCFEPT